MRKINDLIEWMFINTAALLFAVFIGAILWQVAARSLLSWSVRWTDEVALMCFVWSVFLGAAVALRRGAHYVVDILSPERVLGSNLLRLFGSLACLPIIWLLITHGQIYADMGWRRASMALEVPLFWIFVAIPVSGVAMAIFSIEVIWDDIRRLITGTPPPVSQDEI
ncbi:MAG: TRAP transporter small permease [Salinarimonas sp.]|nr:TRAP transporter small permease [Salinarimonas sp.]